MRSHFTITNYKYSIVHCTSIVIMKCYFALTGEITCDDDFGDNDDGKDEEDYIPVNFPFTDVTFETARPTEVKGVAGGKSSSPKGGDKHYVCSHCGKVYAHKQSLQNHEGVHKGVYKFRCEICNKGLNKRYELNVHMESHRGDKPEMCSRCGKQFSLRSNRKRHERTCQAKDSCVKEMVHICPHCGKGCRRKSDLTDHVSGSHNEGKKPYSCNVCFASFNWRSSLRCHTRKCPRNSRTACFAPV